MDFEVIVIGGGIGGLTTAALLAARGVNVCLFERQSRVGGCVANFEHLGYTFEPTAGLYSGWEPGGIYERVFSELPVKLPEVQRLSPAYVVRLPDQSEISVCEPVDQFEANLREGFPECSGAAVLFYRTLRQVIESGARDSHHQAVEVTAKYLTDTSFRFRSFIDAQLELFTQCMSEQCDLFQAAHTLTSPQRGLWAIRGGAQTLADALAQSLKASGGTLRLNAPVLRLAFDPSGVPAGVDLLSGERVNATCAIVSNLTVWDTYGKLVGLSRIPKPVSAALKKLHGRGAYLMFLAMDEDAGARLPADHILVCHSRKGSAESDSPFFFAAAPSWGSGSPATHRAVTISTLTNVEEWFTFHEDGAAHEAQDQAALELWWGRLHAALPELGAGVELIETATPRTFYESTRRKFGMVGKPCAGLDNSSPLQPFLTTSYPNLFLVGDTVSSGSGLEAICESALSLVGSIGP